MSVSFALYYIWDLYFYVHVIVTSLIYLYSIICRILFKFQLPFINESVHDIIIFLVISVYISLLYQLTRALKCLSKNLSRVYIAYKVTSNVVQYNMFVSLYLKQSVQHKSNILTKYFLKWIGLSDCKGNNLPWCATWYQFFESLSTLTFYWMHRHDHN